jgi:hypothetical protein
MNPIIMDAIEISCRLPGDMKPNVFKINFEVITWWPFIGSVKVLKSIFCPSRFHSIINQSSAKGTVTGLKIAKYIGTVETAANANGINFLF